MNTLETLQAYAKSHWITDKTKLTNCTIKNNGVTITEQRLWIWHTGNQRPTLVTNSDLTGKDKDDFMRIVK